MVCYCTQDSSAWTDPLHTCAIAGSDKFPPFQCTVENLINVVELQRNYEHVLRTPDFLTRPEMQQLVGGSVLRVKWLHPQQGSQQGQQQATPVDVYTAQLLAAMQAKADADLQPVLPLFVTEGQLRQRLGRYTATVVVDLGMLVPGWFAGFESQQLAANVQQMVRDLTIYVGWCCLLEAEAGQNMDHAYVTYQKPVVNLLPHTAVAASVVGLVSGVAASVGAESGAHMVRSVKNTWVPDLPHSIADVPHPAAELLHLHGDLPHSDADVMHLDAGIWQPDAVLFERPTWCNSSYLRPLNHNVSLRAQHPCQYLGGIHFGAALQHGLRGILLQLHDSRSM
jgi:hypothetical protein